MALRVPVLMFSRGKYLAPTPLLPFPPSLTLQGTKYVVKDLFSSPEHFAENAGIAPLAGAETVNSYVQPRRAQPALKPVTFQVGRASGAITAAEADMARRVDARSDWNMIEV